MDVRRQRRPVIGTASPNNHAYLISLGVTPVAHGPGLLDRLRVLAPGGVDVVLDCAGGEAVTVSLALGVKPSRVGTIADHSSIEKHGVRRPGGERSAANLSQLVDLHGAGRLQLPIHLTVPWAAAARAHIAVETRHVRGKVVLTHHLPVGDGTEVGRSDLSRSVRGSSDRAFHFLERTGQSPGSRRPSR